MNITFKPDSLESYRQFLAVKQLPHYRIQGRTAWFPDEYAHLLHRRTRKRREIDYTPPPWLFDYQRDMMRIMLRKRKYALFWDCGLGKTPMILEFVRVARDELDDKRGVLILSPLNVIEQTIGEVDKFYHFQNDVLQIEQVHAAHLGEWLQSCRGKIGITNYEALRPELEQGQLGALVLDESSILKSHYGKWGQTILKLGRGLEWKLCCTGTPAPNDRIEYANHAVFLDSFSTVNGFLATFFVNRGQTQERWVLKPHALRPFYTALSHWCHFLSDPSVYGWHDNTESIPPIHVHIHEVDMTDEQTKLVRSVTGELFASRMGGITRRGSLGQVGKGFYRGEKVQSHKPQYIRSLIDRWIETESTLVWCLYNAEQDELARLLPCSGSIDGSTPYEKRMDIIRRFKSGEIRTLISKPKILGFGLNLQKATRQVFSGLADSYESYYQAIKRSNRYGSTRSLNVHIPVTDIEEPMVQNVLRKAKCVQQDTEEQERLFKELAYDRN
jgi:superfamily II DNA or RNA helicase